MPGGCAHVRLLVEDGRLGISDEDQLRIRFDDDLRRELRESVTFRGGDVVGATDRHHVVDERVIPGDESVTGRVQRRRTVEVGCPVLGVLDRVVHFLVGVGGRRTRVEQLPDSRGLVGDVVDGCHLGEVVDGLAGVTQRLDVSDGLVRRQHQIRLRADHALDVGPEVTGDIFLLLGAVEVERELRQANDAVLFAEFPDGLGGRGRRGCDALGRLLEGDRLTRGVSQFQRELTGSRVGRIVCLKLSGIGWVVNRRLCARRHAPDAAHEGGRHEHGSHYREAVSHRFHEAAHPISIYLLQVLLNIECVSGDGPRAGRPG